MALDDQVHEGGDKIVRRDRRSHCEEKEKKNRKMKRKVDINSEKNSQKNV